MDTSTTSSIDVSSLTDLQLAEYSEHTATGKCLLAQYTDREVIVYQAYRAELGTFAAEHDYFGGGFNFDRTSWIKPNFTWMMHRCGWASKYNQEVVLALHLRRDYWDSILSQAVMSSYAEHLTTLGDDGNFADTAGCDSCRSGGERGWRASLRASNVVMQWDPDHKPFTGHKTAHRVIQLGLRREALEAFRGPAFGEGGIQDVTGFVKATEARHGREAARGSSPPPSSVLLPAEVPYPVHDDGVARRLGVVCASSSSSPSPYPSRPNARVRTSETAPQAMAASAASSVVPSSDGSRFGENGASFGGNGASFSGNGTDFGGKTTARRFDVRIPGIDCAPPPPPPPLPAGPLVEESRGKGQTTVMVAIEDQERKGRGSRRQEVMESRRAARKEKGYDAGHEYEVSGALLFWQPPSVFSQWTPSTFVVDEVRYVCAEQYMMAEKAKLFGDEQAWQKIMDTVNPKRHRALGRGVRGFDQVAWVDQRRAIVDRATYAKFTQNPDMQRHLLSTGEKVLAEASPFDRVWGIGLRANHASAKDRDTWRGENILGQVLQDVRTRIRTRSSTG